MKRLIILCLCILLTFSVAGCDIQDYPYKANYKELGAPINEYYAKGTLESCAWDVEILDDALYVGSGDYDKNKGPVNIWRYDFLDKSWYSDGIISDEQIERFYVFDGKLYAAGYDPRGSWDKGNFYVRENLAWTTNRVLPGGIHNFDLIKFDGKLFAGMGVVGKDFPVAVSSDGESFTQVPLVKNGQPIKLETSNAHNRVYDFFTLNDKLYAYHRFNDGKTSTFDIYCYDGEKFVYYSDLMTKLETDRNTFSHINQKVEFNGKKFIAMGNFYVTEDMKTAENIELKPNIEVLDLRVIDNKLYVLCNEKKEKNGKEEFRISVWFSTTGNIGSFRQMFFYNYPVRALSFTYGKDAFYFGMGYGVKAQKNYDQNGMVLKVDARV
ncbi:MAG: hypothetical protein J6B80_04660 [Clostridia bacterium]|nr:hypothetical protein [Clostridia bacterium]